MTTLERFEEKYIPEPMSGCWLWTACRQSDGYGEFKINKKMCLAHRIAWTLYVGEIPEGLYVLHHCDNRTCVNPDHLFIGTAVDNTQDMIQKNRKADSSKIIAELALAKRAYPYCKAGHELSGGNLYLSNEGKRFCRTCRKRWCDEYYRRNKSAVNARSLARYKSRKEISL